MDMTLFAPDTAARQSTVSDAPSRDERTADAAGYYAATNMALSLYLDGRPSRPRHRVNADHR